MELRVPTKHFGFMHVYMDVHNDNKSCDVKFKYEWSEELFASKKFTLNDFTQKVTYEHKATHNQFSVEVILNKHKEIDGFIVKSFRRHSLCYEAEIERDGGYTAIVLGNIILQQLEQQQCQTLKNHCSSQQTHCND